MTAQEAFELDVLGGKHKPEFDGRHYRERDEYSAHVQRLWEAYCRGVEGQHRPEFEGQSAREVDEVWEVYCKGLDNKHWIRGWWDD